MVSHYQPPYYAVIFISKLSKDTVGYDQTAEQMVDLAQTMPGFLGLESAREESGITVSFWQDEASIENWKQQADHQIAQQNGRAKWYASYEMHIARVERYKKFPAK
jgi:heme-degrading monooxygenase HmoA